jgi:ATP-dependent helicase HrpB
MLPIDAVLPDIRAQLNARTTLVLRAPPGAGKTTRVPLALLDAAWLANQKIIMLEPRRLAARNAAMWMAQLLGEEAGGTVGYRTRLDTKVSARTRIEVVTEGVLARMLQSDPGLEGVGLVIFDEFHERSIHSDTALALCLDMQQQLRDSLRILVMSATIDVAPIAKLLHDAPIVTSEGRTYPVDIRYLGATRREEVTGTVVRAIVSALRDETGSVLVFLPGAGEIRRVEDELKRQALAPNVRVYPLYGDLAREAQEQAIEPCTPGQRKVVLATAIAETSLTIEGVRVVVDSGLQRVPRFDPNSGMTRLETLRVSQASSVQRAGRAGRMEPGICFRAWSESEQKGLRPFNTPEILEADLAPLALELAQWGVRDPDTLAWLDPLPQAALSQARELLQRLDALDADERIAPMGRAMAELSMHPRLAHMVVRGRELGLGGVACDLAALLGERDVLRARGFERDADIRTRLEILVSKSRDALPEHAAAKFSVDRNAVFQVRKAAQQWQRSLRVDPARPEHVHEAGLLLAFAYPDRIGQRRGNALGRYVLANGRGAFVPDTDALARHDYLVAADLDGVEREARIFLAAPVELREIETHFGDHIVEREHVIWDSRERAVSARKQRRLESLVLSDKPLPKADPELVVAALLQGIRETGIDCLPWTKATRQLRRRWMFVRASLAQDAGQWPDVSDAALMSTLERWLAPYLQGITRLNDLQRIDLHAALLAQLDWSYQQELDRLAPTHFVVPTGSRIPLDYETDPPTLAVRLQELFGLADTPKIANGRVALTLQLLSPAHRPVQVTRDLAGFWKNSYHDVKKDMKGRYPKHYWPDDPLQAEPTRRAKPRGT